MLVPMKKSILLIPLAVALASCDRESSAPPKAVAVPESDATAPAPEPMAVPPVAVPPPAVAAEEPVVPEPAPETPGEHLDHALQKTGLRKAADATGNFLKRAGEKIEDAAEEGEEP